MSQDFAIKSFVKTERAKKNKGYTEIKMSLGTSTKPIEPILTVAAKTEYLPSTL
jgi:hypothetical protein